MNNSQLFRAGIAASLSKARASFAPASPTTKEPFSDILLQRVLPLRSRLRFSHPRLKSLLALSRRRDHAASARDTLLQWVFFEGVEDGGEVAFTRVWEECYDSLSLVFWTQCQLGGSES